MRPIHVPVRAVYSLIILHILLQRSLEYEAHGQHRPRTPAFLRAVHALGLMR